MNKTAIKNFAIWARNKLIADIRYKAGLMGITAEGINKPLPQSTSETEFYDIGTAEPYSIRGEAIKQRKSLVSMMEQKSEETDYATAYKYVIESVAYTWFNRLIAIRFMEVNDYLPSHIRVLSSESGKLEPDIVTTPFDADLPFTDEEQKEVIRLKSDNDLDACFRMLFIKQCNALNDILPPLFEKTSDYTELLLNVSAIDKDGVVYHLINDISEDDFNIEKGGQVEIIGWMYQYYNTEPKNEAFSKKEKISKEEIPAVTQLFTPDWIVRYMVENSLGRIWVEGHPNESLQSNWKYYLEEAEQESDVQKKLDEIYAEYAKLNPEDIHFIDPCMGSGHILVYAFEVLMQIYESQGYSQRDAARSILENNLYGLDIDDRAYQMAYFAVMRKARQYNRRILSAETPCHVYSIQESNTINRDQLQYFGAGLSNIEKNNALNQIIGLLDTFRDAKEYGSILAVENYDWKLLRRFTERIDLDGQMSFVTMGIDDTKEKLIELINIGETMARKYEVCATNPPYMGLSSSGNAKLNNYVKDKYEDSKADLFAVFIEKCSYLSVKNGYYAMITMHAWMFLQSFLALRTKIISEKTIVNLLHLGANAFSAGDVGSIVQTASFVLRNSLIKNIRCNYIRLVDYPNEEKKNEAALNSIRNKNADFYSLATENYYRISGCPLAYWVSEKFFSMFKNKCVGDYSFSDGQNKTGNNDKYIRNSWEVCKCDIGKDNKWVELAKGGGYRKWYGNIVNVIDWSEEARCHYREDYVCRIIPEYIWYKKGITWGDITTKPSFRILPEGATFETAGLTIFPKDEENMAYLLGVLNSCIFRKVSESLNATFHTKIKDVMAMPLVMKDQKLVNDLVNQNIEISRDEWDFFEISIDYKCHPLAKTCHTAYISEKYEKWTNECIQRFEKLKANEEELNSIFIDVYGLQNELTPEVDEKDVTVRKADLQRDIKSLISYAVGCMFGRYSLDVEGLAYAGGEWDTGKYTTFIPDADNIIPITDEEYFEDDILGLFVAWLKKVYGSETLEQNLDFIAKALGNKGNTSRDIIRNYFLTDFFKDHCQTYSVTGSGKRPIYWLFDSGKQNGFKALIYLHRYNADTIGNLRVDYLHRMQRVYESEIGRMQDMIDHSTNSREVGAASRRKEKLQKQLKECRDYDEKIGHLALARTEIDLDDGVKVNYRKLQTANDGKFYEVLADSKNIMAKK